MRGCSAAAGDLVLFRLPEGHPVGLKVPCLASARRSADRPRGTQDKDKSKSTPPERPKTTTARDHLIGHPACRATYRGGAAGYVETDSELPVETPSVGGRGTLRYVCWSLRWAAFGYLGLLPLLLLLSWVSRVVGPCSCPTGCPSGSRNSTRSPQATEQPLNDQHRAVFGPSTKKSPKPKQQDERPDVDL